MPLPFHSVIILILVAVSTVAAAIRYWQRRGNQTWQTVEGRIFQAVHFTEDEIGRTGGNYVRVMYSYQVNGEFYSGELLRSFATFGQAERFSSRYKKDLPVIIRVHPHKPNVSVFREDDNAARLTQATATF